MPAIQVQTITSEYVIEYQKKDEILKTAAPNLDDVKDLFDYLWSKTGRG